MKKRELTILYEDEQLLIVDKPPGILSVSYAPSDVSLTDILNRDLKAAGSEHKVFPCHRLDKETSGAMIFAKSRQAQEKMMGIFKKRKVRKTYIAFIQGVFSQNNGVIKFPLDKRQALTEFKVLKRYKNFSVLEVYPLTGRKNQIRLHLKMKGFPLVGESRFALRKNARVKYNKRVCLHAKRVEFTSPFTSRNIIAESPLPSDLQKFLDSHS